MTTDEKLAAILAAVQTDPGNRGLGRDPEDNLFTATAGDFAAACRSIAEHARPALSVVTGFFIPTANPPAMETDGPLGAVFLVRGMGGLGIDAAIVSDASCENAVLAGLKQAGQQEHFIRTYDRRNAEPHGLSPISLGSTTGAVTAVTHRVAVERVGPAADGRCYTMRGRDVSKHTTPTERLFTGREWLEVGRIVRRWRVCTIGIGDGGNEIGMGKIPHDTVVKNIPNGERIHCRVPTDHLIVAGVSNWGAYALAAGVYVLRGVKPSNDLFDPDGERAILDVMVRDGPLVDGVTGEQTATVDGLSWEAYSKPLARIREILES
jgi:hypothetical protein